MQIKNPQADAHPSNLTLDEFGKAMSRLDLSSVPDHLKSVAIREHMTRIMVGSIKDPSIAFRLAQAAVQNFRR